MHQHAEPSCWQSVDGILVINLDKSMDRWDDFVRSNRAALPMEKVERLSGVMGVQLAGYGKAPWFSKRTGDRSAYWGGCAGCTLSHRRAIEHAKSKGWRNVMIMEDDVMVGADTGKLLDAYLPHLRGAYIVYAGYSRPTPYGKQALTSGEHSLWQVEGVLSTFAYIVSAELYDKMLARLPKDESDVWRWLAVHRALDNFYQKSISALRGVSAYCMYPDAVLVKESSYSEITQQIGYTSYSGIDLPPHSLRSLRGFCHRMVAPLRRLKFHLNAVRTLLRCRLTGFPGARRRRKK